MVLAILSLAAGFLSVLAPCVLPLLPIIIGGSVSGKSAKYRPYIIIGSLVASLVAFTWLLKISSSLIGINPDTWSYLSGGIVIALGLTMLFPEFWDKLVQTSGLQAKAQQMLGRAGHKDSQTGSAVLTGMALGPVFSSCSPMYAWVIATVLPANTGKGLLYLSFYCIGLAAALLGVSLLGRKLLIRIKWASNPRGLFQKIIAVLFIAVGLAVFTGYDKTVQTYLVGKDIFGIKTLEEALVPGRERINSVQNTARVSADQPEYFNVTPYQAPELVGLQEWINSDPLTLAQLKGKVVLIDFWTYSCINCERTLPYLSDWYSNYHDDGFEILGLHAPEFAFEKVPANVRKAVADRDLKYPVALDNNFTTWRAYENRFWPAHYLIDKNGQVRREHFGEGEYDQTEAAIRDLLKEAGANELAAATAGSEGPPVGRGQTPETYIGLRRAESFTNPTLGPGEREYSHTDAQPLHTWSISGKWTVNGESATCVSSCQLKLTYKAKDVYAVFSTESGGQVTANGASIDVSANDIYTVISTEQAVEGNLLLEFTPGVAIHAFTFGS